MKVRFYVSLGSAMTTSEDIIEIPSAEFKNAKTETQIDEVCQRWAKAWAKNKIVIGFNR